VVVIFFCNFKPQKENIVKTKKCIKSIIITLFSLLILLYLSGCASTKQEMLDPEISNTASLVTLETRPGIDQKFILIKPNKPVASVILFAGGHGALNLSSLLSLPNLNGERKIFWLEPETCLQNMVSWWQ
jgi:hypothetical protein